MNYMKKLKYILVAILVISSLFYVSNPIMEVRYNTYDKTVDCYNEGHYTMPEGCASSIFPTVTQTWAVYIILLSSLGLGVIGIRNLVRSLKRKK